MTLPDELVTVAAEAANGEWTECYGSEAKAVVAAVLRALPESDAIEEAVRSTVYDGNMEQAHRIARRVIAAITKLAGDA